MIRPREHLAARDSTPLPDLALEWAHVDDWVAVLVKPAGVAVQGDTTDEGKRRSAALRRAVAAALPPPAERPDALSHPQFVHRLDKGRAGLVYARTQAACARLATAFATPGAVRKTYVALVAGRLDGDGVVDEPVSGRPARSRWRALGHTPSAASGWVTTLELKPEHGRRHQLREALRAGATQWNAPLPDTRRREVRRRRRRLQGRRPPLLVGKGDRDAAPAYGRDARAGN